MLYDVLRLPPFLVFENVAVLGEDDKVDLEGLMAVHERFVHPQAKRTGWNGTTEDVVGRLDNGKIVNKQMSREDVNGGHEKKK